MTFVPLNVNLGKVPRVPNGRHQVGNGHFIYIQNGSKHRLRGPAEIRKDGYKAWFKEGKRHRTNGPAVVHPDGTKEYWEDGKLIRKEKPGGIK